MNAKRITALVALVLVTTAAAQEGAPPVAKEMAKFDAVVGNWQGSGIVRAAPDAPEMKWTSVSTSKLVLGGHFVMDQVKIEAEGMPVPILLHSMSGWDSTRDRYVSFEVGNTGEAKETTVHFVGNKLITTSSGVEEGSVVADHWVSVIDGDEMHFTGHRSIDGGPFFVHVEGISTRGGPGFSVGPETAAYTLAPPSEHMKPLQMMTGTWDFEGSWKPSADADAMTMNGREKMHSILGGHVVRSHVKGQGGGMDYEAVNFIAWSDTENSLVTVGFSNMGEYNVHQCWIDGSKLMSVGAGIFQGQPMASTGVMTMSSDEITWEGYTSPAAGKPFRSFEGTWTRAKR